MEIQFSPPDIGEREIEEVVDTLRSGWITTGPKTKEFERKLSSYLNSSTTIALNSATAAMEMVLRLLGVGEGDEVITTPYTYTASASVIDHVGAKIVMVDLGKDSFEMDYDNLANYINEKTKAIIPVDIGGVPCDYSKLLEVLELKKDLYTPANQIQENFDRPVVITDSAHSLGALYKGKAIPHYGDFSCYSFHAVKNLTTAEGGSITWREGVFEDNQEIYQNLQLLSLHGQSKDALAKSQLGSWEYDIVMPGYKNNMTDIMASLGLVQLERYPDLLDKRKSIVGKYNKAFKGTRLRPMVHETEDKKSSYHLYIVNIEGADEEERNSIIRQMAERKIATNVHYKPLPLHTAYKNLGFDIKDYPQAFERYQNAMTLPLHTLLSEEQVDYVIENLLEILR